MSGVFNVEAGEGTVDVGEIRYVRSSPVKVGDPAPAVLALKLGQKK